MNVSLDKLKIFYQIVKENSFKNVAGKLNLQPSAISHAMTGLEKDLGFLLMTRSKGGIKLTIEGQRLYDLTKDIFLKLDAIKEYLSIDNQMSGELNITTWYGVGSYFLANYVFQFRKEYPDLKINIIGDNRPSNDFESFAADACILPYLENRHDLDQLKVFSTPFCAYASREYIDAYGEPTKFSDLDNHRLLSASTKPSRFYMETEWHLLKGKEENEQRKTYFTINSSTGIAKYCLNGAGIGTLPPYFARAFSDKLVQLFPDYNPPEIDFYYIYPKYAKHLDKITKFGEFLRQEKPKLIEVL